MGDFSMPSLGADMESGTLLEWRVAVGDPVHRGDIVAVVDTDKSAVEVEVFEDGVVEELLVEPGTEVAVGTPLARIGTAAPSSPVAMPATAAPVTAPVRRDLPPSSPERHHDSAHSPLVRRLAGRLGVDLSRLEGTGPGGRITRDDVEREASRHEAPPNAPARRRDGGSSPLARRRAAELGIDLAEVVGTGPAGAVRAADLHDARAVSEAAAPPRGDDRNRSIRQAIARQMTTSNREIPHYHLSRTFDLDDSLNWLTRRNERSTTADRVLPAALLARATALAVRGRPELNGYWIDDSFQPSDGVHLAIAVALRGGGLLAPVIHDADRLGIDEIMTVLRDLVARARRGSLRASELSGASITLTDLGDRGADSVQGIIHPPQVALVGFGRIAERPWAIDGLLGVRRTVVASVAGDHRATDGHAGSALLADLADLLADPDRL